MDSTISNFDKNYILTYDRIFILLVSCWAPISQASSVLRQSGTSLSTRWRVLNNESCPGLNTFTTTSITRWPLWPFGYLTIYNWKIIKSPLIFYIPCTCRKYNFINKCNIFPCLRFPLYLVTNTSQISHLVINLIRAWVLYFGYIKLTTWFSMNCWLIMRKWKCHITSFWMPTNLLSR